VVASVDGWGAWGVMAQRGIECGARRTLRWSGDAVPADGTNAAASEVAAAMAMKAHEIESLIKARLPDARVTISDLAGDGDHYAATVVSSAFAGKTRVEQHQIVYEALKGSMDGRLHALALQTSAPKD